MIPSGNLQSISKSQFDQLIERLGNPEFSFDYQPKKHRIEFWKRQESLGRIYLPIDQSFDIDTGIQAIDDFYFGMLVIKAGQAVSGCFHNGNLIDHKVFRAYMVRKKQGKSQIKHLKTKGKSRAGSRVRLESTKLFFEEINERLNRYSTGFAMTRWGISCGKTLWPYLFDSEVSPPFQKNEDTLYPLPFHVSQARFEALEDLYKKITSFQVTLSPEGEQLFGDIFVLAEGSGSTDDDSDDW